MKVNDVKLAGSRILLRPIDMADASYLFTLRTNPKYNTYLSPVSGNEEAQRTWLASYIQRHMRGEEYYFVIWRLDGVRCGVVRLYNLQAKTFTWGSWILDDNKPKKAALESALLSFGFGFDTLGLNNAHLEVRKYNERALNFYRRMGAVEVRADEQDIYFEYSAEQFYENLCPLKRLIQND